MKQLATIKAVLFDLYGTIAYVPKPVTETEISEYLFSKGYEVSPQQVRAAWSFVSFIDYPKYGYKSWQSYFQRIFWRLKVKIDKETLDALAKRFENSQYQLHNDAADAVKNAKENGFKTAIVTTIAYFQFRNAVKPIKEYLDFIMTGYEAGCDKSNPKMYKRVLEILGVRPEEAIMIGDDIPIDILLPKKLGINAILLDREKKNVPCTQANAIVNNLNGAIKIVLGKFNYKGI